MAAMKKLERLLDLVALLLETERPLTRHEIRDALPPGAYAEDDVSFRRTFERDKDELRELGLPIVLEAVAGWESSGSGYRIHRSAMEADLPALDPEELASLALASAMVASTKLRLTYPSGCPSGCSVEPMSLPTWTGPGPLPRCPGIRSSGT